MNLGSGLFYDILDDQRKSLLPLFSDFKNDFYLAGGTGLALQLGHRDSVDFDLFSNKGFSTNELFEKITLAFPGKKIKNIQEEKDTLSILIEDKVKVSFFAYKYPLLEPLIKSEYFNLCSFLDIGCMKLSALISRAMQKDYVDLYFISQKVGLEKLLGSVEKKFPSLDYNLVLKSLVYFEDLVEEPINYKNNNEVDFEVIKSFFREKLKSYFD
jgi:hypothetical protein